MKRSAMVLIVVVVIALVSVGANLTGFSIFGDISDLLFGNAAEVVRSVEQIDESNFLVTLDVEVKDAEEKSLGVQEVAYIPACSNVYDISDGGVEKFGNIIEWIFVNDELGLEAESLESKQVSYKIRYEECFKEEELWGLEDDFGGEESGSGGITGFAVSSMGPRCGGADINNDGIVDEDDLKILNKNYKDSNCKAPSWCGQADINQDGEVGYTDFEILAANYGLTCEAEELAECLVNSDCRETEYEDWENFCEGDDVHKKRKVESYSCVVEECKKSTDYEEEIVESCEFGCGAGVCLSECSADADCAESFCEDGAEIVCDGGDVYAVSVCHDFNCVDGSCAESESERKVLEEACEFGCRGGLCTLEPVEVEGISFEGYWITADDKGEIEGEVFYE